MISRDDFDRGRIDFRDHIEAILRSFPAQALAESQIEARLRARLGGLIPNHHDFLFGLRDLEVRCTITKNELSGLTVWAITERESSAG